MYATGSRKLNKAQAKAKEYVDKHKIEKLISEMVNSLVHTRDKKPIVYMIKYLANHWTKEELEENGISVDGPLPQRIPLMNYPEFTENCTSLLKAHLTKEIWSAMKKRATHLGGKVQLCVQWGVYDESDPIGIYATDEEAYKVFDDLFIPIIQDLHPDYDMKVNYRNEFELVSAPNLQKLTRLVVSVRRNFKDHPFTPMMSTESKFQVEKKIVDTLGEVYGQYHRYSKLDDETKAWLDSEGIDINRKKSHDSSGINEDWPNGRGIFIDDNKEFVVLVNFEDHIQIITICNGGDYNKSLSTLLKLLSKFEKMGYAKHTSLGFLTASPKNLGTALNIEANFKLSADKSAEDLESFEGTYSWKINKIANEEYQIIYNKTLAKNLTENDAFNEFGECINRIAGDEVKVEPEEDKQQEQEVKIESANEAMSQAPQDDKQEDQEPEEPQAENTEVAASEQPPAESQPPEEEKSGKTEGEPSEQDRKDEDNLDEADVKSNSKQDEVAESVENKPDETNVDGEAKEEA